MRLRNQILALTGVSAVRALAVTGAILALAPAGASALEHPSPNGRCRVSLDVAPRHIAAGDPVTAYGRLVCFPQRIAAGQTVQLYERSYGTAGYAPVGSATTDTRGFYALTESGVQTNSSFYVRAHGAQSGRRRVRVEALVTLDGPASGSQLLTGAPNKVTFTGTVSPADGGARVILQRQNALTGNEWRRIGSGIVGPEGAFTIEHTFVVPGDANIRALVRSQGRNAASFSNELSYEISQAQNPQLTINASANPIEYGQSVTISGVAAGLANQPVELLSRVRHQHGFTQVAQTTTNAGGEYTFPAQAPTHSAFYEVRTGAKVTPVERSAVLFEGVKDVLTASVSPSTTVQAGQELTFSGTVTPAHQAPHIIYLERQNASGQGFHVVNIGSIGAGSTTYSLAYRIYAPGTRVFRVRIPGGPDNEGAVSQTITITITPAPASALTPEAGSNSALPSEGSERNGEEREGGAESEGQGQTGTHGPAEGNGDSKGSKGPADQSPSGPSEAGNEGSTPTAGGRHKNHHGG
jgi:hypothetical protein